MVQTNSCPNLNHRRSNAPVRACPFCGNVVNSDIPTTNCSVNVHARRRKDRNKYCVDCSEQLIQ